LKESDRVDAEIQGYNDEDEELEPQMGEKEEE